MGILNCALNMEQLVFDKIEFNRKGFMNNNELSFNLQVQIGQREDSYKVTLILNGTKKDEYDFLISLSGFFSIEKNEEADKDLIHDLITKNSVAIMMPYLRSEVSLLTAQPNTAGVLLPPINVSQMLKKN